MRWSNDTDQQLLTCVEEAEPLRKAYSDSYTQREWWSTIAGLMLARYGHVSTGGACQTRFNRLTYAARHEPQPAAVDAGDIVAATPGDGWDDVIQRVSDWERDWHDRTSDDLEELTRRVRRIEGLVLAMALEWGVDAESIPLEVIRR